MVAPIPDPVIVLAILMVLGAAVVALFVTVLLLMHPDAAPRGTLGDGSDEGGQ
jgi:hypothetical protein